MELEGYEDRTVEAPKNWNKTIALNPIEFSPCTEHNHGLVLGGGGAYDNG